MTRSTRRPSFNLSLGVARALLLAGCAGFNAPAAPPFRDTSLSIPSAQTLIVSGQSTRRDVAAALGTPTVITFDSGFEVWAYRNRPQGSAQASAELVILFEPSGVVRKSRTRGMP